MIILRIFSLECGGQIGRLLLPTAFQLLWLVQKQCLWNFLIIKITCQLLWKICAKSSNNVFGGKTELLKIKFRRWRRLEGVAGGGRAISQPIRLTLSLPWIRLILNTVLQTFNVCSAHGLSAKNYIWPGVLLLLGWEKCHRNCLVQAGHVRFYSKKNRFC